MQLRALLPYLLIFNGLGHQPVNADATDATNVTVQTDSGVTADTTATTDTTADAASITDTTTQATDTQASTEDTASATDATPTTDTNTASTDIQASTEIQATTDTTTPSTDATPTTDTTAPADSSEEACSNADAESSDCPSWDVNCSNVDDQAWIPTFTTPTTLPSYQDIITCTNTNDAYFAAQIAAANQALQTHLDQCIVNGACDEEQIAALINAIQDVYKAYVRQSAFLAYLKAQRLQDEAQYQAYQTQLAALQASIQQAAQQAIAAWQAVVAGTDTAADALAASQAAATSIATTQGQIDQVNAQVAALLALLATNPGQACPAVADNTSSN